MVGYNKVHVVTRYDDHYIASENAKIRPSAAQSTLSPVLNEEL